jgi:hypothetical protein
VSHDHFFVFLDQLAARAAERSTAVAKTIAFHAMLLAHTHAVDELQDPRDTTAEQRTVESTLTGSERCEFGWHYRHAYLAIHSTGISHAFLALLDATVDHTWTPCCKTA